MLRINTSLLSFAENLYESGLIRVKHFKKGSLLVQQGYALSKVYILKHGISKCYYSAENGKNYILEFLSEGEILGDIELIKKMDCLCTVEALTEVEAFAIPVPLINSILQKDIAFSKLLIEELADKVINTSVRSSVQQLYSIQTALDNLLTLQSKQNIFLAKEDIAAYLGITLRSLNRLLSTTKNSD